MMIMFMKKQFQIQSTCLNDPPGLMVNPKFSFSLLTSHSALPGGQYHPGSKFFYHFLFYFMFTDTLTRRNPKYFS